MKQKLKRALNEDRAGIAQSDPSVALFKPREAAEGPAPELKQKEPEESRAVRAHASINTGLTYSGKEEEEEAPR